MALLLALLILLILILLVLILLLLAALLSLLQGLQALPHRLKSLNRFTALVQRILESVFLRVICGGSSLTDLFLNFVQSSVRSPAPVVRHSHSKDSAACRSPAAVSPARSVPESAGF